MSKKIISLATLLAFIIFSISCTIYKTERVKINTDVSWRAKNIKVLSVVTKSGETIKFPKTKPGRIYKDSIIGTKREEIEIDKYNVEKTTRNGDRKILKVITKDGKTYYPISAREQDDKIICTVYTSIPLSEVEQILFKNIDFGPTLIASIGVAGLSFLIVGGLVIWFSWVYGGLD